MRTNIVLDDELVKQALKLAKVKTKRELIDMALREFIEHQSKMDLRELKNKISFQEDYDYKQLRREKT